MGGTTSKGLENKGTYVLFIGKEKPKVLESIIQITL